MSDRRLIVGLGNPGRDYEWTRHNLGFLVIGELARQSKKRFSQIPGVNGFVAQGTIAEQKVRLLLPLTYMNNSGQAVKNLVAIDKLDLEDILIVCDDCQLDFGQIRLRVKGSAGGHNGLLSIIAHLQSEAFARLRCGIGRVPLATNMTDYVLNEFTTAEHKELKAFTRQAAECCKVWLTEGSTHAMNQFNKRKDDE